MARTAAPVRARRGPGRPRKNKEEQPARRGRKPGRPKGSGRGPGRPRKEVLGPQVDERLGVSIAAATQRARDELTTLVTSAAEVSHLTWQDGVTPEQNAKAAVEYASHLIEQARKKLYAPIRGSDDDRSTDAAADQSAKVTEGKAEDGTPEVAVEAADKF